jgi:hypothetical protein
MGGRGEGLGHRGGAERRAGGWRSDPMREADAPSTGELQVCFPWCARPTGDSHTRTTRGPAQRFEGAKRRPRCGGWVKNNAANDTSIIRPEPESPGLVQRPSCSLLLLALKAGDEHLLGPLGGLQVVLQHGVEELHELLVAL